MHYHNNSVITFLSYYHFKQEWPVLDVPLRFITILTHFSETILPHRTDLGLGITLLRSLGGRLTQHSASFECGPEEAPATSVCSSVAHPHYRTRTPWEPTDHKRETHRAAPSLLGQPVHTLYALISRCPYGLHCVSTGLLQ